MIGKKSFTNLILTNDGSINFGDGNKALICIKESISAPEILELKDVLYVEGIKDNFINISQICDNKYSFKFTQKKCTMYNSTCNIIVKGTISKDNCVGNPLEVICKILSLSTKEL